MGDLSYDSLLTKLLEVVPVLRVRYENWVHDLGEEPGPHLAFGTLLVPYIMALVESGSGYERLPRLFAFLEELAVHPDQKVQEVVAVSVCEDFSGQGFLHRVWDHMGPATRRIARDIAMGWGHPLPESRSPYEGMDMSAYTRRFKEEIDALGGPANVGTVDVLDIRERLFKELGYNVADP